jgi:polyhydroxyalkanoate synthesis repressor PhaR
MRLIRKQKNRRLYDTVDRRNVTLQDLAILIGGGESIRVEDGTSGDDISRLVLLQIVVEQESPAMALLSQPLLEGLIRLANNPMQQMAASYLEASVASFERSQGEFARRWQLDGNTGSTAGAIADAAQESLRSWMSLQRSIFDAWSGNSPDEGKDND